MIERLFNLRTGLPWLVIALTQTIAAGALIAARLTCNWHLLTGITGMLLGSACGHWLCFYLSHKGEKLDRARTDELIEKLDAIRRGEDTAP